MVYEELEKLLIELPFDTPKTIYSSNKQLLFVSRPSKLSRRFSNYVPEKNFQIWLKQNDKAAFRPNHFRLMIDLYTRVREFPNSKNDLLLAFDKIFYGEDPIAVQHILDKYDYVQSINPLDISLVLAQLFIAEQNIGFGRESKYNPRSLYIQGWIRTFIDADYEIDQILSRFTHNNPPKADYTKQDDKNHSEFNINAYPLWYK